MARPINCIVLGSTTSMLSAVGAGAQDKRIDQFRYNDMVMAGDAATAFNAAFEASDELTEHNFTAEQGVGMRAIQACILERNYPIALCVWYSAEAYQRNDGGTLYAKYAKGERRRPSLPVW